MDNLFGVPCDLRVIRQVVSGLDHEFEIDMPDGSTVHARNRSQVGALLAGFCGGKLRDLSHAVTYTSAQFTAGERVSIGFWGVLPAMVPLTPDMQVPDLQAYFKDGVQIREDFIASECARGRLVLGSS